MNWYTIFYLFSLSDKFSQIFGILSVVTGICLGITLIAVIATDQFDDEDWATWRKFFFTFFISFFISISIWTIIPNKKDMLLIIAGGAVGNFVTSDENAKAIPSDITRFLRKEILEATSSLQDGEQIKEALGLETEKDKLMKMSKEELVKLLTSDSTKVNQ
jgi:hypothetical protein